MPKMRFLLPIIPLLHSLSVFALDIAGGVSSSFIESSEGWSKVGKDSGSVKISHAPLMLSGKDDGPNSWWFAAPASFIGDKSNFYGGSLEYKVGFWGYNGDFQRSSVNDKWDVVLVSDKLKIGLLDVLPPLAFLHQVQINLTESSGWLLESSKRAPTKQEFKNVLSKLSGIWIRGGYYAGGEEVYLMGVKLNKRAGDSGDLEEDRKKKEAHMEEHPDGEREAKLKFDFELKGSEGVLGFDSKTLYFLSKNTMQPRSVPFSDITSVDVGSDDIVQIYGPNHRVVMTAGRFTSYNVSQLAKFFETVRKKTDEVKKGSDRANDRGKDSPKYDGRGSKQESSTKNVEGQEQKRRQTAPDEQGQTFQEKQERETEKKRPKKQAQYEEEHEDIATETPKHERTSKIHKHTENLPRDNFDDANIKRYDDLVVSRLCAKNRQLAIPVSVWN
uniref:Laminin IV type A domain-containing protein n=1 Tax=Guillardia theta TaxID=55529 RepID=A0A7S4P007_GUITH|mmetsp:Transcript_39799/g.125015  ORF Transcript_39799/g.125015 Transcript_39799/m.125015 type:complete len:443 (+) Transcript_39799:69-1397(+)